MNEGPGQSRPSSLPIKVYIQRQNELAICKLKTWHRWMWTSCYREIIPLIGTELKPDETVELVLTATQVKRIGTGVFERDRERYVRKIKYKEKTMGYLFKSKKYRSIGGPWSIFSLVGAIAAWKLGVPNGLIAAYLVSMGLVIAGHMIAYGMSDAAHALKEGIK